MCGSWRGLRTAPEETLSAVTQAVCAAGIQGPGPRGEGRHFSLDGAAKKAAVWRCGEQGVGLRRTRGFLMVIGRGVEGRGTDAQRAWSSGDAGPVQGDVRGLDSRGSTGVRWGRWMTCASS